MDKIKIFASGLMRLLVSNRRSILAALIIVGLILTLFLKDLVSVPGGMSTVEHIIATTPVGWSGILADPFYLPMKIIRSVGFLWFDSGGALVSRLPSVIYGLFAVLAVGYVTYVWHGTRVALFTGALFATNAWTLHVSRYASYDSSYLLAIPLLLATIIALQRIKRRWVPYAVLFVWSILLFTPGLVWLVLLAAFWQRYSFVDAWQNTRHWAGKIGLVVSGFALSPLLIYTLVKSTSATLTWVGLPVNFGSVMDFGSRLADVPINLFIAGPAMPELWLGRLPLLDVITLIFTILGVTYYVRKWRAGRAQLLAALTAIALLLIGLGGAAGLSLIVPAVFIIAGAGIAQFYGEWLKHFPKNPLARSFGTVLIILTIGVSATYNLRNYFIAWPNAPATVSRFDRR